MRFNSKNLTLFSPGFEPGTFCVLDRCDNHYTTKTDMTIVAITTQFKMYKCKKMLPPPHCTEIDFARDFREHQK